MISTGLSLLNNQAKKLENIMKEFAVPMLSKPPENAKLTLPKNEFPDKTIYNEIFIGMQASVNLFAAHFNLSRSARIRALFLELLKRKNWMC